MSDSTWPISLCAIFLCFICAKRFLAVLVEGDPRIAILTVDEVWLAADDHHEASQIELTIIDETGRAQVSLNDKILEFVHKADDIHLRPIYRCSLRFFNLCCCLSCSFRFAFLRRGLSIHRLLGLFLCADSGCILNHFFDLFRLNGSLSPLVFLGHERFFICGRIIDHFNSPSHIWSGALDKPKTVIISL